MRKIVVITTLVLALFNTTHGQIHGQKYRQFLANPYLFNPAYVGLNNQSELNLVYRQQWVNFKDAPVITGLNVQFPTNNRVAFGFSFTSDKQVLLRNSTIMSTFGYVIPISENESLRFALSAGLGMNSLDINAEEQNSNDPALMNAANNNFYIDGNVGVLYANAGLKIGFAFTDLFNSKSFSQETFNKFSLSNLKNRIYSMSYRFNVGVMENLSLEPYVIYRQSTDGLQNSWEAASLIHFKDKIWTGAGYHQHSGLALFLGMNVKEKFKFNYSYEFPPFKAGAATNSAHELHLTMKFGNKKTLPFGKNKNAAKNKYYAKKSTATKNSHVTKPAYVKPANEVDSIEVASTTKLPETGANKNPENSKVAKDASALASTPKTTGKPAKSFTIAKGHYVVVAVFSRLDHSTKFTKQLTKQGYGVNVALNPKNKFYYVYIFASYNLEEARKARNQYRWKNLFKEAWVFTME